MLQLQRLAPEVDKELVDPLEDELAFRRCFPEFLGHPLDERVDFGELPRQRFDKFPLGVLLRLWWLCRVPW